MKRSDTNSAAAHYRHLYHAILVRALDDLNGLLCGMSVPGAIADDPDSGAELAREEIEDERQAMLSETLDWFLDETPSPCSLDVVCDALGMDADEIRRLVQRLAHGEIATKVRRRKLTRAQIVYILGALARGETTKALAREMGINVATVRKIRIRERARANGANVGVR